MKGQACEALPQDYLTLEFNVKAWRSELIWRLALAERNPDYTSDPYVVWGNIMNSYTRSDLTKGEDKLIAISGIAKEAREMLRDVYLAGLWKRDLLVELLWQIEPSETPHRRPQTYRAPSWSWASIDGVVKFAHWSLVHPLADVVDASVQPLVEDSTGQVVDGHVQIRAILGRIDILSNTNSASGNTDGKSYQFRGHPINCEFDIQDDLELEDIHCLMLSTKLSSLVGLLLRRTNGKPVCYRRVGTFDILLEFRASSSNLVDILDVPKGLFFDSADPMSPPPDMRDWWYSERSSMPARIRNYLKPSMQFVTISKLAAVCRKYFHVQEAPHLETDRAVYALALSITPRKMCRLADLCALLQRA